MSDRFTSELPPDCSEKKRLTLDGAIEEPTTLDDQEQAAALHRRRMQTLIEDRNHQFVQGCAVFMGSAILAFSILAISGFSPVGIAIAGPIVVAAILYAFLPLLWNSYKMCKIALEHRQSENPNSFHLTPKEAVNNLPTQFQEKKQQQPLLPSV